MLHIIGSIIIIWTCSSIGICVSNHYATMTKELSSLLQVGSIIKGEIKYAVSELAEVFLHAADRSEGSIEVWLRDLGNELEQKHDKGFDEIWCDKMIDLGRYSSLDGKQLDMVNNLGHVLGFLDVEAQINSLTIWEENIRYEYENMRDRLKQIRKLATMLGFLSGVIIVIILI